VNVKKQGSNEECIEKSSYLVYKLEPEEVENRENISRGSMIMYDEQDLKKGAIMLVSYGERSLK
jgi:hypothetical protein